MKRFVITLTIKGPSGLLTEVPNRDGPVEYEDILPLLKDLPDRLPCFGFDIEIVGVKVEQVGD